MKDRRSWGFLAMAGAAGLVAVSCGSSNGAPSDAGADIAHKGQGAIVPDGGDEGGDGAGSSTSYDGTTGLPCKTDADCVGPGGPGINKCSNSVLYNVINVQVTLLPTPYCVVPPGATGANCDPAPPTDPSGAQFHYCDGPDDPNSPGICVPFPVPGSTGPVSGQGHCEVACTYTFDGMAPTGCPGQDACTIIVGAVASDPTTNAILGGIGYCQGACEKDSDCTDLNAARGDAGLPWVCQVDIGYCTQHPLTTPRSKPLGASCTVTGRTSDVATGACNCGIVNSSTNKAYCTSACIVGGTVPCPDGWACDSLQSALQPDGVTPLKAENIGLPGVCVPRCTLPGDGGAPEAAAPEAGLDASTDAEAGSPAPEAGTTAACPAASTCQAQTPNGPECLP